MFSQHQPLFRRFEEVGSFASLSAASASRIISHKLIPKPHQEKAANDVISALSQDDRCILEMACGTGKTLTSQIAAEIIAKNGKNRILVCAPTLNLVAQNLESWMRNTNNPDLKMLVVCSDHTIVSKVNNDDTIIFPEELKARVTNDPKVIADFLQGHPNRLLVSTYDSLSLVISAMETKCVTGLDIAIADEAHRTAVAKDAANALFHNDSLKISKRLYATATPKIFNENGGLVCSMDNESIFGKTAHRLPFSEAIKQGLLCDYQVVVAAISESEVIRLPNQSDLDYRYAISEVALRRAISKYSLSHIVTFHSRKDFAEQAATHLNQLTQNYYAAMVTGDMPTRQRQRLIDLFQERSRNQISILTNCRCLGEGVDVPGIDGIVFFDRRDSEIDIIQAVGRAIRRNDEHDKKIGTIIIPVVIPDHVEDIESFLSETEFKKLAQVLRALRTHDDRIESRIRFVANGIYDTEADRQDMHIHIDFGAIGETLKEKIQTRVLQLGLGIRETTLSTKSLDIIFRTYLRKQIDLGTPINQLKFPSTGSEETVPAKYIASDGKEYEIPGVQTFDKFTNIYAACQAGARGLRSIDDWKNAQNKIGMEFGISIQTLSRNSLELIFRSYLKAQLASGVLESRLKLPGAASQEAVPKTFKNADGEECPIPGVRPEDKFVNIYTVCRDGYRGMTSIDDWKSCQKKVAAEFGIMLGELTTESLELIFRAYILKQLNNGVIKDSLQMPGTHSQDAVPLKFMDTSGREHFISGVRRGDTFSKIYKACYKANRGLRSIDQWKAAHDKIKAEFNL